MMLNNIGIYWLIVPLIAVILIFTFDGTESKPKYQTTQHFKKSYKVFMDSIILNLLYWQVFINSTQQMQVKSVTTLYTDGLLTKLVQLWKNNLNQILPQWNKAIYQAWKDTDSFIREPQLKSVKSQFMNQLERLKVSMHATILS